MKAAGVSAVLLGTVIVGGCGGSSSGAPRSDASAASSTTTMTRVPYPPASGEYAAVDGQDDPSTAIGQECKRLRQVAALPQERSWTQQASDLDAELPATRSLSSRVLKEHVESWRLAIDDQNSQKVEIWTAIVGGNCGGPAYIGPNS